MMSENRHPPVTALVVDDHNLFRRGLIALLSREPRLKVIGEAGDASEATRRAAEIKPDIIQLDNHLPGVTGIDALPGLRLRVTLWCPRTDFQTHRRPARPSDPRAAHRRG